MWIISIFSQRISDCGDLYVFLLNVLARISNNGSLCGICNHECRRNFVCLRGAGWVGWGPSQMKILSFQSAFAISFGTSYRFAIHLCLGVLSIGNFAILHNNVHLVWAKCDLSQYYCSAVLLEGDRLRHLILLNLYCQPGVLRLLIA